MTEKNNNELRVPRENINLEKGEPVGSPKISKTNWKPSSSQEELRKKGEERLRALEEQVRQEFECRPEIQLIRALERKVETLTKEVKSLKSK